MCNDNIFHILKQPIEAPKKKDAVKKEKDSAIKQNTNSSITPKPTIAPVIAAVDPEQAKILEAEKMAQLLLEEEEAEKKKAAKKKK